MQGIELVILETKDGRRRILKGTCEICPQCGKRKPKEAKKMKHKNDATDKMPVEPKATRQKPINVYFQSAEGREGKTLPIREWPEHAVRNLARHMEVCQ